MIEKETFTPLEKKFVLAFENFDIEQLKEALDEGMDINANPQGYYQPSLLAEVLFDFDDGDYERWCDAKGSKDFDVKSPIKESKAISFIKFCVENGFNINNYYDDVGEIISTVWNIIEFCYNEDVVRFILEQKPDLNYFVRKNCTVYNYAEETIFCDTRGSDAAKFMYYRLRLLTYYGAKPYYMITDERTEKEKALHEILFTLDAEKIKTLTKDEILEYKLDSILIDRARFYYPEEWYCEIKNFQQKLIDVLAVLVEKIGIENLSNNVLHECVCQQMPDVMEFLLSKGANPNENCFNEHFSYVKSSALYKLYVEGSYFTEDLRERFKTLLLNAGAELK